MHSHWKMRLALLALVTVAAGCAFAAEAEPQDTLVEARSRLNEVSAKWPLGYHSDETRATADLERRLGPLNAAGVHALAEALLGETASCKLPTAALRRAVAALQKDKTVEQLTTALRPDAGNAPPERMDAVAALVALADRRELTALPEIVALLQRDDQALVEVTRTTLLEFASTREGAELVLRGLFDNRTDESEVYLSHALETALSIHSRFTAQYLSDYVRHPAPQIRVAAIRALALQPSNRETNGQIAAALHDKVPAVVKAAANTLRMLKSFDQIEPLIAALDHPDAAVRTTIHAALKDLTSQTFVLDKTLWSAWLTQQRADDARKFNTLTEVFALSTNEGKAASLEEMAALLFARDQALNFALKFTREHDFVIRAAALHLLSQVGGAAAIQPLIEGLSDPHQEVAYTAHRGLERLTGVQLPLDRTAWSNWFSREN